MKENQNIKLKPRIERKRHIAKTITWRIVGTLDTLIISWFLLDAVGAKEDAGQGAGYIAGLELMTKTILYYFHERIWYGLNWITDNQKLRHIIKTISWRFVGAIDTLLLVFIVYYFFYPNNDGSFNYEQASIIALAMFSIEIVTKIVLYYLHERFWFSSKFGIIKPKDQ